MPLSIAEASPSETIQLYRETGEKEYLDVVDETLAAWLDANKDRPVADHSLHTGRGAMIRVLLERYVLDNDPYYIEAALHLIRPVAGEFLHSPYTTDYLSNGRAGVLLLLIELYRITAEPFLLGYIQEFVSKILSNAQLNEHGICWTATGELLLGPSPGFDQGAAGIQYALEIYSAYFDDETAGLVARSAGRYVQYCMSVNNGDHSRSYRPVLDVHTFAACREAWENNNNKFVSLPNELMEEKEVRVKSMDPDRLPVRRRPAQRPEDGKRTILAGIFPRTLSMLENLAPAAAGAYLSRSRLANAGEEWEQMTGVLAHLKGTIPSTEYDRLMDVFLLEKEKYAYSAAHRVPASDVFLDNFFSQEKISLFLCQPDEWLMDQSLTISGEIQIVRTKWQWNFQHEFMRLPDAAMITRMRHNLQAPSGGQTYVFFPSGNQLCGEFYLDIPQSRILQHFSTTKTIRAALKEIRMVVLSLPSEVILEIMPYLDVDTIKEPQHVDLWVNRVIFAQIRILVNRRVLVFNPDFESELMETINI